MSQLLNVITVPDPRIELSAVPELTILATCQNSRVLSVPAASTASTGSVSFSTPVFSSSLVDRTVWIKLQCQMVLAGADQSSLLSVYGNGSDALRFMGFQQGLNNIVVSFNGLSFSKISNEETVPVDSYMWSDEDRRYFSSMFPSMQDNYQAYSDSTSLGSALNPLAAIGNGSFGYQRGGWPVVTVSSSNTATTYTWVQYEPILCPPFLPKQSSSHRRAFAHCSNISMQCNINSLSKSMWSHSSNGNTISSYTFSFTAPPELLFTLYQQNELSQTIPKQLAYETHRVIDYPSAETSLTTTSSAVVSVQSVTLSSLPDLICIVARQRLADRNQNSSDTFAEITSVSLDLNSRSALLSTMSQADLYAMSVRNGLKMSFPLWKKNAGSILYIKPADLGLPPDECASCLGNWQMSIRVGITNNNASTVVYQVHNFCVNSSLLQVDQGGMWSESTGYLTSQMVVESALKNRVVQVERLGRGWFSNAFNYVKDKVHKILPIAKIVSPLVKIAYPPARPFLEAVGLGIKGGRNCEKLKKPKGRPKKGRGIVNDEDEVNDLEEYMTSR
jgi:hypothetical protein